MNQQNSYSIDNQNGDLHRQVKVNQNQRIFTENELLFLQFMKKTLLSEKLYIRRDFVGKNLKNYLAELSSKGSLSSLQREVLIGALLGDGTLHKGKNAVNVNFKYELTEKSKELVDCLYFIFQDLVGTPPRLQRRTRSGNSIWFCTYRLPELRHWQNIFYALDAQGNNVRRVPDQLHKWITPLSLAIWFMDDGNKGTEGGYYFHTQYFTLGEARKLQQILGKKFHLEVSVHYDEQRNTNRKYLSLYILKGSVAKFNTLVEPFILPCMQYKLWKLSREKEV
jgi:hypothetical protein